MHRYTVELRIMGPNIDPDEVTRTLGISPSQVRKKGMRKSEVSTWPVSMWALEIVPDGQKDWSSLEDGLTSLLSRISPLQAHIQNYMAAYDVCIWCGHFTSSFDGGPTLSPSILKLLGDTGVQLILDTYCEKE